MTDNHRHDGMSGNPAGYVEANRHRGDLVERLLQLAEDPPTPPEDGRVRLKAAIRPLWQQEVRLRRQRRRSLQAWAVGMAAAAVLVLAVGLVLYRQAHGPAAGPVATLSLLSGALEITTPDGGIEEIPEGRTGLAVQPGSWLRTGEGSRAALELAGGQSVRLDGSTRLRLASASHLDLTRGAVYVDSGAAVADSCDSIEVETAFGTAYDIGTQFEVRVAGSSLSIRVREGMVLLSRDGAGLEIRQESTLQVLPDGSLERGAEPGYGLTWSWVQEIAPPLDIEGITVLQLLDWVSRETGLWIGFAEPADETFAGATTLHGTIEGLTPAQAPGVVLPGCGMTVRREQGMLLISRTNRPRSAPDQEHDASS